MTFLTNHFPYSRIGQESANIVRSRLDSAPESVYLTGRYPSAIFSSAREHYFMAVPKRKTTPSRRNMRRSHDSLQTVRQTECTNCGELKRPHHICQACGHYHGREVAEVSSL